MSPLAITLAVVGAGGVIGSNLVHLLARIPVVRRLVLIDQGTYTPSNLAVQLIEPGDVGKPKATVQARRVRRLRPDLDVVPLVAAVEELPLGRLRVDLLLGALDSRRARMALNQAAWRLGVPWIDSGVEATSGLARVTTYRPGAGRACLECAWDPRHYESLEQEFPCADGRSAVPATGASSALGALAASLLALECQKALAGATDPATTEILVDSTSRRSFTDNHRPAAECRMPDHDPWSIRKIASPADMTLGELFALGAVRPAGTAWVSVPGIPFVRRVSCPSCGRSRRTVRLRASMRTADRRCARCGAPGVVRGFDLANRLEASALSRAVLDRPLSAVGLRVGEVVSVIRGGGERHFELDGRSRAGGGTVPDPILERHLQRQQEEGLRLAAESDLLDLFPEGGSPARRYVVRFHCRGLVRSAAGAVEEANRFDIGVHFSDDYLRRADTMEVLTWLAPRNIFHPNVAPGHSVICLGRIYAGTPLVDLIYRTYELVTYKRYNTNERDALNVDACAWARRNRERFPIDPRPLKRRARALRIEIGAAS